MPTLIPLLLVGIFHSIYSGLFLFSHYSLVKANQKASGVIVAFDRGGLFGNTLVPIIRFKTAADLLIEGIPECPPTTYMEINGLDRHDRVTVYYQRDKPEHFVVEGTGDVIFSGLVIAVTLGAIVWFFAR